MVWWPIHSINTNFLQVIGRSDLFLKVEIIKKVGMIIVLCISIPFGIVAFCWGVVVQNLVALYANTYYTGKLINYNIIDQLKDILPCVLLSGCMFTIVYGGIQLLNNLIVQLIVGCIVGVLFYSIGAYVLKYSELFELKDFLKRR